MSNSQNSPVENNFGNDETVQNSENVAAPSEDAALYDSFSDQIGESPAPQQAASPEQARIQKLEEDLKTAKDHMMRALAEAENARKRAQREREDASKYAVASFSRDILSVADNLRRALSAVPADLLAAHPQIKNLTDGIEATERELLRSFEKNGIQKLEPIDQPFDPNFHEVMFEAPVPGKASGTIIQVIEAGYTLNGRILRPARVGIAKDDGSTPPPSTPGQKIDTQA